MHDLQPYLFTESAPKDEVKDEPDCMPSTSAAVVPKSKVVTRVVVSFRVFTGENTAKLLES